MAVYYFVCVQVWGCCPIRWLCIILCACKCGGAVQYDGCVLFCVPAGVGVLSNTMAVYYFQCCAHTASFENGTVNNEIVKNGVTVTKL